MIVKTYTGAEVEVPEPMSNPAGRVFIESGSVFIQPEIDASLKAAGVTSIEKTNIVKDLMGHGKILIARGMARGKRHDLPISIETRPDLAALVENFEAISSKIEAADDANLAEAEAQKEAEHAAKVADLLKLVPQGHILCTPKVHRDSENGDWVEYSVEGVPVDRRNVVVHGWSDREPVASISPENLEEARTRHQSKQVEKAAEDAERQAKYDAETARREELKAKVACQVLRRGVEQNEEPDPFAVVRMTSNLTGETLEFTCRNIFDAGYAVNPRYAVIPGVKPGGLAIEGKWNLWPEGNVRDLTEFESLCIDYLKSFPPITTEMRM